MGVVIICIIIFLLIMTPTVIIMKIFDKFDEQRQRIEALQTQLNRIEDLKLNELSKKLDALTTQDIRQGVAALFCEHTGKKPWSRPDDVLEKLVTLWQEYTGLCTHEATAAERV